MFKNPSILNITEVMRITGFCHATIYRKMAKGLFPKSISIGNRKIGWKKYEIDFWMDSQVKGG